MRTQKQRGHTFVEIAAPVRTELNSRILTEAYSSSRNTKVLLWLHGVSASEVNRILDPVVADEGVTFPGVEYVVDQDVSAAARLAESADYCVITDTELAERLERTGRRVLRLESGIQLFQSRRDLEGTRAGSRSR